MTPEQIDIHDQRWPWCKLKNAHTHEDTMTGTYVNGEKVGPIWKLTKNEDIVSRSVQSPYCQHYGGSDPCPSYAPDWLGPIEGHANLGDPSMGRRFD